MRVSELRLSEQQQELSRQMASMVREYDEDKREALERYANTIALFQLSSMSVYIIKKRYVFI